MVSIKNKKKRNKSLDKWDIFKDTDGLVSKKQRTKKRRYVVIDIDTKKNMKVMKIKSHQKGRDLIYISRDNPTLTKESGIEKEIYEKSYRYNKKGERLNQKHIKKPQGKGKLINNDIGKVNKYLNKKE